MNKPDDIFGVHLKLHEILNAVFPKIAHLLTHIEVDGQRVPALIDEWNTPERSDIATDEEWALAVWYLKEGLLQKFLHEVIYDNRDMYFQYIPKVQSYSAWQKGLTNPSIPAKKNGNKE